MIKSNQLYNNAGCCWEPCWESHWRCRWYLPLLWFSPWHVLQSESFRTNYLNCSLLLQDVFSCTFYTTHSLQEKENKQKVSQYLFSPAKEIRKFIVGFIKSLLFAGGYACMVRRIVCLITQYHKFEGCKSLIMKTLIL